MAITKIQSNAFPASIDLSNIDLTLGANEVLTANIADSNITTAKIADGAVHTDKIADNNVTHAKLHTDMDLSGKTVTLPTIGHELTVARSNVGNPAGITIRNTEASSAYSHARLRLESQNGAAYSEIWTDVANSALRLGYNSSSTLNINSSGSVGIGTSSPSAPLHIKVPSSGGGLTDAVQIRDSSDYVGIAMYAGAADGEIRVGAAGQLRGRYAAQYAGTRSAHSFAIGTNNTTAISIDDAQNTAVLISDSNTTQATLKGLVVSNSDGTTNNGSAISFAYGTNGNSFSKIGVINTDRTGGSEDQDIFFGNVGGGSYSESMRIKSTGNVGIGTASPNGNLHLGSGSAVGTETNPAIQIGGTNTYRLGLYTESEAGVIDAANGDNGLIIKTKTKGSHTVFRSSGAIWHPEYDNQGDYTSYICSISEFGTNGGATGRYLHIMLQITGGDMFWLEGIGYHYSPTSSRYGRMGGYYYSSGPGIYAPTYVSDFKTGYQLGSARIEVVFDTGGSNSSNRWGSYVFRGGTDTITSSNPIELVQYTWSSGTGQVFPAQ